MGFYMLTCRIPMVHNNTKVNPELFTKFATELGEAFSDRMEVLVNPKDKVPGPTYRGDFAGSMGMLGQ